MLAAVMAAEEPMRGPRPGAAVFGVAWGRRKGAVSCVPKKGRCRWSVEDADQMSPFSASLQRHPPPTPAPLSPRSLGRGLYEAHDLTGPDMRAYTAAQRGRMSLPVGAQGASLGPLGLRCGRQCTAQVGPAAGDVWGAGAASPEGPPVGAAEATAEAVARPTWSKRRPWGPHPPVRGKRSPRTER